MADPRAAFILAELRKLDLAQRRRVSRGLPLSQWKARMFFHGAPDAALKAATEARFAPSPKPEPSCHPIFVLGQILNLAHEVCPCSTKNFNRYRFIPEGCQLEGTGWTMPVDSFLIEDCKFNIPPERALVMPLNYKGRVPEGALRES